MWRYLRQSRDSGAIFGSQIRSEMGENVDKNKDPNFEDEQVNEL